MTATRGPGKEDVSRPEPGADYTAKKRFYQRADVAGDYDFHRFGNAERERRNVRKWRAICAALARADGVRTLVDLPCGTGRFTGHLARSGYDVVGADISMPMMSEARKRLAPSPRLHGFLRADAERLPLASESTDCVMSIRFLHHVDPPTRIEIVREMARVSRRWLILDFRHRRSYRYVVGRIGAAFGFPPKRGLPQVSRSQLDAELAAAGVRTLAIFPIARFFSDKWVVLCEKPRGA